MNQIVSVMDELKTSLLIFVTEHGIKLVVALLIFIIGWQLIKYFTKAIDKAFKKSKMDLSLSKFLISAIRVTLKVLLIVIFAQQIGIQMAPVLAVVGAAGLGVGMALQGSLANLTGGILILLLRPFSIGDYISEKAFGHEGTVDEIHVFYTTLITRDNKEITIPNGALANNSIINFTKKQTRRVDLEFGADYKADTQTVKNAIAQVIEQHPLIIKEMDTVIKIKEHGDHAVKYMVLVWCNAQDYLTVKYDIIESVKLKFDEMDINIPYPQLDVHMV